MRVALRVERLSARTVDGVRAVYDFRIALNKVEPHVLHVNPLRSPISLQVTRRVDYDKRINVETDLTADERRAVGEGGQGSTRPDTDPPEPGQQGRGDGGDVAEATPNTRHTVPEGAPDYVVDGQPGDPQGVWRDKNTGEAVVLDGTKADGTPRFRPVRHAGGKSGNFGEVMGEADLRGRGMTQLHPDPPHRIGDASNSHGIDSIFHDPGPPPRYVVVESKYRSGDPFTPPFPKTTSGDEQMSPEWIEDRVLDAVGQDRLLADEIMAGPPQRILQRIGPDGKVQNIDLDTGKDIDTGEKILTDEQLETLKWR